MAHAASGVAPAPAVVVTGGAGYVGSAVVRCLVDSGWRVVVLDDLSRGHADAVPAGVPLVVGSVLDGDALDEALSTLSGVVAIVHLAGVAYVGESMVTPGPYFEINTCGTLRVCQAALRHGVGRIAFSSSCTVYAPPRPGELLTEASPLGPISPYGESKRQAEGILDWFGRAHGLHVAVLRYFNAAGAHGDAGERHDPEPHLIPRVLRAALRGGPEVAVYGGVLPTRDGTCERDFVHIGDIASAHVLALTYLERESSLIANLGTGKGHTVKEVITAVERITGRAVPWCVEPHRSGDAASTVALADWARRELGWVPRMSELDRIIEDAWLFLITRGGA